MTSLSDEDDDFKTTKVARRRGRLARKIPSATTSKENKNVVTQVTASRKSSSQGTTVIDLDTPSPKRPSAKYLTESGRCQNGADTEVEPKKADSSAIVENRNLLQCKELNAAQLCVSVVLETGVIAPNSVAESSQVLATSNPARINTQGGQSRNTSPCKPDSDVSEAGSRDHQPRNQPRTKAKTSLTARFGKREPERMQSCRGGNRLLPIMNEASSKSETTTLDLEKDSDMKSSGRRVDTNDSYVETIEIFFCHICHKEITHMNSQRRLQHMNRCLDTDEMTLKAQTKLQEAMKKAESAILDCPLCGKALTTAQSRKAHIKKCGKTLQVPPDEILAQTRQQEQAYSEKLSSGDIHGVGDAPETGPSTSRNKVPKLTKRRRKEPKSKFEEDIQTAIALSESLREAPSDGQTDVLLVRGQTGYVPKLKPKRGKKKKIVDIPPLVARTYAERQRLLAARVETLILPTTVSMQETPKLKRSRLDHQNFTVHTPRQDKAFWSLGHDGPPVPKDDDRKPRKVNAATTAVRIVNDIDGMGVGETGGTMMQLLPEKHPMSPNRTTTISSASLSPGGKMTNQTVAAQQKLNATIVVVADCDGNECDSTTGDSFRPFMDRGVNTTESYELTTTTTTCQRCDVSKKNESESDVSLESNILEQTGFFAQTNESSDEDDSEQKISLIADMTFMVGNVKCSDVKVLCRGHVTVPAHRFIFMARCPRILETVGDSVLLDLSDIDDKAVLAVLHYLYTGQVRLEPQCVDDVDKMVKRFGITGLVSAVNSLKDTIDAERLVTSFIANDDDDDNGCHGEDAGCHSDDGDQQINEEDVAEIYEFMATQRQVNRVNEVNEVNKGDSNNNLQMSGSDDDALTNDCSSDDDLVLMGKFNQPISVQIPPSCHDNERLISALNKDDSSELPDLLPSVNNVNHAVVSMTSQTVRRDVIDVITPPSIDQSPSPPPTRNSPPRPQEASIHQFLSPEMADISNDKSLNLFDDSIIEMNSDVDTHGGNDSYHGAENVDDDGNLELDLDAIDDIEKVLFPSVDHESADHHSDQQHSSIILPFLTATEINEICNSPVTDEEREELRRLRHYCDTTQVHVMHSPASSVRSSCCSTTDKATQSDLDSDLNDSSLLMLAVDASTSPMRNWNSTNPAAKKKKSSKKDNNDPNRVVKKRHRRTAYDLLMAMSPPDESNDKRPRQQSCDENDETTSEAKRRRLDSGGSSESDTSGFGGGDSSLPGDFLSPRRITQDHVELTQVPEARDIETPFSDSEEFTINPETRTEIPESPDRACNDSVISIIEVTEESDEPPPIPLRRSPIRATISLNSSNSYKIDLSPKPVDSFPDFAALRTTFGTPTRREETRQVVPSEPEPRLSSSPKTPQLLTLSERLKLRQIRDRRDVPEHEADVEEHQCDPMVEDDIDLGPDPWADSSTARDDSMLEEAEPEIQQAVSFETKTPEHYHRPSKKKKNRPTLASPFTPMPNYETMPTPQIKRKVQDVGVKAMPKKKMVALLKHIYSETHQYETDPECDTPVRPTPPIVSAVRTLSQQNWNTNNNNNNTNETSQALSRLSADYQPSVESQLTCLGAATTSNSSRTNNKVKKIRTKSQKTERRKKVEIQNVVEDRRSREASSPVESDDDEFRGDDHPGMLEESILPCDDDEPSTQQPDLRDRVLRFLMENIDLYFKILRYQPLELEDLKTRLTENGIKIGTDKLLAILDDQCITFRMKNTRNNRTKKTTSSKTSSKSSKSNEKS